MFLKQKIKLALAFSPKQLIKILTFVSNYYGNFALKFRNKGTIDYKTTEDSGILDVNFKIQMEEFPYDIFFNNSSNKYNQTFFSISETKSAIKFAINYLEKMKDFKEISYNEFLALKLAQHQMSYIARLIERGIEN